MPPQGFLGCGHTGYHSRNPEEKTGQQCWKNSAPALFVLVLTGGCAGYARGAWEKERLDREEVSAREFTGTRVTLQGRIGKTEQGNGSLSLVLEDVKARVGKTDKDMAG